MGKRIGRTMIILFLALVAGFFFGRYGLGEGYLKKTMADIGRPKTQNMPRPEAAVPEPEPVPELSPSAPPLPGEGTANAPKPDANAPAPSLEEDQGPPPVELRPAEPPPDEPAAEEMPSATRFSLQVGRFEKADSAQTRAEEITSLGYPARVQQQGEGDKKIFRVLVGSYPDEEAARRAAEELRSSGYDAFISKEKR